MRKKKEVMEEKKESNKDTLKMSKITYSRNSGLPVSQGKVKDIASEVNRAQ
jgi:hypothetical protein